MEKNVILTVAENVKLTENVYRMRLLGDCRAITKPGQFINIKLDGFFLRRPISVFDCGDDFVTIIYKVVGSGTELMATLPEGKALDVLVGLGNGFDVTRSGENPVVIGGGVGVPPMYKLAKELIAQGKNVTAILGFNTEKEIFAAKDFADIGCTVKVTTVDGSFGIKGFVTDALDFDYTYTYCCGPLPMLKAVYNKSATSGEYSFEERMGCGFGACMGCTCKTLYGNKRICKDGPVLVKEEIIWG